MNNLFQNHLETGEQSTNVEDMDQIGSIISNGQFNNPPTYDDTRSDNDSFLTDTFKRAREVGYPIGPLIESGAFDPRPSTHFTTDEYDY